MLIGEHYLRPKNVGPLWLQHMRNKAINRGYWPDQVLGLIATDSLPAVNVLVPLITHQVFSCSAVQHRHNNSRVQILTIVSEVHLVVTTARQRLSYRKDTLYYCLKKRGRGFEFYSGQKWKKNQM